MSLKGQMKQNTEHIESWFNCLGFFKTPYKIPFKQIVHSIRLKIVSFLLDGRWIWGMFPTCDNCGELFQEIPELFQEIPHRY